MNSESEMRRASVNCRRVSSRPESSTVGVGADEEEASTRRASVNWRARCRPLAALEAVGSLAGDGDRLIDSFAGGYPRRGRDIDDDLLSVTEWSSRGASDTSNIPPRELLRECSPSRPPGRTPVGREAAVTRASKTRQLALLTALDPPLSAQASLPQPSRNGSPHRSFRSDPRDRVRMGRRHRSWENLLGILLVTNDRNGSTPVIKPNEPIALALVRNCSGCEGFSRHKGIVIREPASPAR